jgi:hypothetical protein
MQREKLSVMEEPLMSGQGQPTFLMSVKVFVG